MRRLTTGFSLLILGWLYSGVVAAAQGDMPGTQSNLEYTLGTLKQSVTRLGEENRNMAAVNDQLRIKRQGLNSQLSPLKAQEAELIAKFRELEPRHQERLKEKSLLEGRLQQALSLLKALDEERRAAENALINKESENSSIFIQIEALTQELADIRSGLVSGEDHAAELEALRAEQSALQKDLDASSTALGIVRDEWKELAIAVNAGPGQVEVLEKDKALLKSSITDRLSEIESLRSRLSSALKEAEDLRVMYSPEGVIRMEADVRELDSELQSLEKQVVEAEKAVRSGKLSSAAEAKIKKDESRFKELAQQNLDRKMGLRNLQRTMVNMDKKKLELEKELN